MHDVQDVHILNSSTLRLSKGEILKAPSFNKSERAQDSGCMLTNAKSLLISLFLREKKKDKGKISPAGRDDSVF